MCYVQMKMYKHHKYVLVYMISKPITHFTQTFAHLIGQSKMKMKYFVIYIGFRSMPRVGDPDFYHKMICKSFPLTLKCLALKMW